MNLSKLAQSFVGPAHIKTMKELDPAPEYIEVRIDDFPTEPREIIEADYGNMVIKPDFPKLWKKGENDSLLLGSQGFSDIGLDDMKRFLASVNLKLDDVVALRIKVSLNKNKTMRFSTEQTSLRPPNNNDASTRGYDVGFIYAPRELFKSEFKNLELHTKGKQDEFILEKLAYQVDYLDQYLNNGIYEVNIYDPVTNDVVRRGSVIFDKYFDDIIEDLILEYITQTNYRNAT